MKKQNSEVVEINIEKEIICKEIKPTNDTPEPAPNNNDHIHFNIQHYHHHNHGYHHSPGYTLRQSQNNHCEDERTQKQRDKLKKKLNDKYQKIGMNELDQRPDEHHSENEDSRSVPDQEEDLVNEEEEEAINDGDDEDNVLSQDEDPVQLIVDLLSTIQPPKVSKLNARSALLKWEPPAKLVRAMNEHVIDCNESDLRYEILLSDNGKDMKFKSIYLGPSLSCRIQDLKPGHQYTVCVQVHVDELQGSVSDPINFLTPPTEPDQPQPPKLHRRYKNGLHLRWSPVNDNGSHISHYVLEYDEGTGGSFVEYYKGKAKQYTLQKLEPSTAYRFRLCAVNREGRSPYSDIATYSTSCNAPLKPIPPLLVKANVNSLHLQWTQRAYDDEFKLQMNGMDATTGNYVTVYVGDDVHHACQSLIPFTDYRFRMQAQNEGGVSPWSEEVVYRTLPACPGRPSKPVVKGKIHAYSFRVRWEPPSDNGGAEIVNYNLVINSGSGYTTIYSGNETEALCDKLTPGTTYQLQVNCTTLGGSSDYSELCTVTTEAVIPGPCTRPTLIDAPKTTSLAFRWDKIVYDGGTAITEYEIETVAGDDVHRCRTKNTEYSAENLRPGNTYTFRVRAVNRVGPGLWSEDLTVRTAPAKPSVPEPPSVQPKSPFQLIIQWETPDGNGAPIEEYRLEMAANKDDYVCVYQGPEKSYTVTGLTPFSPYCFRIQAKNCIGYSLHSNVAPVLMPPAPPAAPTALRSTTTTDTITVKWDAPCDNGSPITHYVVEIEDRTLITDDDTTNYTIDRLKPDTNYKIRVKAANAYGVGASSSSLRTSTKRLPPEPPQLECIGSAHNYIKLKWGSGRNVDYIQYGLEMKSARATDFVCIYKGTAFVYKVNKLNETTHYKFRINASNDAGTSDYSTEYEFATQVAPPIVPKPPRVTEIEMNAATVEWLASRNAFNDPIVYVVEICKLNEQQYRQVYRGSDTKCLVDGLESGCRYGLRVSQVRMLMSGAEVAGPHSSIVPFVTLQSETNSKPTSTEHSIQTTKSMRNRPLNYYFRLRGLKTKINQPAFIATVLTIIGIIIAILITSFI